MKTKMAFLKRLNMDLHFRVLEVFKNGSPFFSLFLGPCWNEEPKTKTKTPFLFFFLSFFIGGAGGGFCRKNSFFHLILAPRVVL